MTLLDLLSAPWAIVPDNLQEMQALYATHLRGDKIDIGAFADKEAQNIGGAYEVHNGVAVLTLNGVIAPKANLFVRVCGGVSAQMAEKAVLEAMDDPSVNAMLLSIDSAGGSVNGTPELAAAVRRFSEKKPSAALCDGVMCSAAYWIGSAANSVYITGDTCAVGSIGVVATHNYKPENNNTEITAGKYKRIASPNKPLDEEGTNYLQAQVDYLYQTFVDAVASNRNTSSEKVLEHMADGRVFIGQQAIEAGLVDGVFAFDVLLNDLAANPSRYAQRKAAFFNGDGVAPTSRKDKSMTDTTIQYEAGASQTHANLTRQQLNADYPALVAEIKAEGAKEEMERSTAVRALSMQGYETLIEGLASDGKTTPEQAAMALIAAQKQEATTAATAHFEDAPTAVEASAVVENPETPKEVAARVAAHVQGATS